MVVKEGVKKVDMSSSESEMDFLCNQATGYKEHSWNCSKLNNLPYNQKFISEKSVLYLTTVVVIQKSFTWFLIANEYEAFFMYAKG